MTATFELLDAAIRLVDYAVEQSNSVSTVATLLRLVEDISQDLNSAGHGKPANLLTAPVSMATSAL